MPPIDGLAEVGAWSNREVTTAKAVPESLLILGGGVVGVEMAQAWSSLGTEVTIVEGMGRILANEEEFAADQVADALRDRGVAIRTGAEVDRSTSATQTADTVVLEVEGGATLEGAASPRRGRPQGPASKGSASSPSAPAPTAIRSRSTSGCASAAATGSTRSATSTAGARSPTWASTRRGWRSRTSSAAMRVARARRRALAAGRSSPTPRSRRSATRSTGAGRAGLNVTAVDVATAGTAGASFHGRDADGTSRLVIDDDRRVIVGATFVGPDVNELIARGDDRGQRRGPRRHADRRRPRLPDPQRDLAEPPPGIRAVADELEGARIKDAGAAAAFGRKATRTPSRGASGRQTVRRDLIWSRKSRGKPGMPSSSSTDSKWPERSR